MNRDLLSAGFLLGVLGIGLAVLWARKRRADREALFAGLVGG